MRYWPKRTKDERVQDTSAALFELLVSFGVLSTGLLLILAGGYFGSQDWLFIVGGLTALVGVYAVGQSLFGLIIEVSIGMAGAMVMLGLVILGYMVVQGYGMLVQ